MTFAGVSSDYRINLTVPDLRRTLAAAMAYLLVLATCTAGGIFPDVPRFEPAVDIEILDHALGGMTPERWREVSGLGAVILAEETFGLLANVPAWAQPIHGGIANGSTPPTCPQGTGNTDPRGTPDGCLTAPTGTPNNVTLFQHTNYFTGYANQSGQTYTTRPAWNVAAVDYPVGIPGGTVFKDPSVGGTLPAGCSYSATGSGNSGPQINCTFSSAGTYTFDSLDLSGTLVGSHGCVLTSITSTVNNVNVVFSKIYWKRDTACTGNYNGGFGRAIVNFGAGTGGSWEFDNCVFDMSPSLTTPGFNPVNGPSGDWIFKYTVFLNSFSDPVVGTAASWGITAQYNYVENYIFNVLNQGHGEFIAQHGAGTRTHDYYEFNNIVEGSAAGGGSVTSNIYISDGNGGSTYSDTQILNNVTIANCSGGACVGGGPGVGGSSNSITSAVVSLMDGVQTAAVNENNYYDNTGSLAGGGGINQSYATCTTPLVWSGNTNMVTGAQPTKAAGVEIVAGTGC